MTDDVRANSAASPCGGLLQAVTALFLFALGLFGVSAIIGTALPFPPVPGISEKVEWLQKHGDEYDTLFLGSSRIYHQVIPELFDRLMAEAGIPTHSFNLGMDAMLAPEDTYLLEAVLARRKQPLKLLVAECDPVATHFDTQTQIGMGMLRQSYWHDFTRLTTLTKAIFVPPPSKQHRWLRSYKTYRLNIGWFTHHLHMALARSVHFGRGQEWIQLSTTGPQPSANQSIGKRGDGYPEDAKVFEISDAGWDELKTQLAERTRNPTPEFGNNESQRALREKQRLAKEHGARMVLVVPPSSGGTFHPLPDSLPGVPFLDFGDPALYPSLFSRPNRRDSGHLNSRGAEIFTRLLVEKLVVALKNSPDETATLNSKPTRPL